MVSFGDALLELLTNWLCLNGRLSRLEYISVQSVNFWFSIGCMLLIEKAGWGNTITGSAVGLGILAWLGVCALGKRYQDQGEDWAQMMEYLTHFIGPYYMVRTLLVPSIDIETEDGYPPHERFTPAWWLLHLSIITVGCLYPLGTLIYDSFRL